MDKLSQLRQRQHDLKTEATALLDKADKDNGRDLTEDEETKYSELEANIEAAGEEIAAEEKKLERRRRMDSVASFPPAGNGNQGSVRFSSNEPNPATTDGFRDLAEFANSVRHACLPGGSVDPRLVNRGGGVQAQPSNYHEGSATSGEGYMIPSEMRDGIWELVFNQDDLLSEVDVEPTNARQVDWIADETTPWGSSGVQARWRSEGTQMTADKLNTEGRKVTLHELYAFVLATEELLEDAPRLNSRLQSRAAQAISWKVSDAIMYGTGAGQPLGWFNSSALLTAAKESGQTADTVVKENILNMYTRLLMQPGGRPHWKANQNILPQLAVMTIGDQPVWQPPNGMAGAPGGFLLGLPIRWTEHAKTLGDKGDIQLVDPLGYYAARRTQGTQFASSMHLYFDYGIEAFRWTFRFGGQPYLSAPVSPANGSTTKSHFVTLAERS